MSSYFEATLLPPPFAPDGRESSRSLDEIGAVTVLGAMVEQRRRTSSIPPELGSSDEEDHSDVVATQKREAIDPSCDAFMKIR